MRILIVEDETAAYENLADMLVTIDPTYSMFLSKSFYEFNIFLTSVNLAL